MKPMRFVVLALLGVMLADTVFAAPYLCQNTRTNRVFVSQTRCRAGASFRTVMDLGRTNSNNSFSSSSVISGMTTGAVAVGSIGTVSQFPFTVSPSGSGRGDSGIGACTVVEEGSSFVGTGELTAGINCDQMDDETNNNSFLLTYAVDLSSSANRSAYVYRTDLLNGDGSLGYAQGVQVFATNLDRNELYGVRVEAVCCPR